MSLHIGEPMRMEGRGRAAEEEFTDRLMATLRELAGESGEGALAAQPANQPADEHEDRSENDE